MYSSLWRISTVCHTGDILCIKRTGVRKLSDLETASIVFEDPDSWVDGSRSTVGFNPQDQRVSIMMNRSLG